MQRAPTFKVLKHKLRIIAHWIANNEQSEELADRMKEK